MNKAQAKMTLQRVQQALKTEFPEMNAVFGKTRFDSMGQIDFKFSLVEKSAVDEITQNDNLIGMVKNDVHPSAIGQKIEVAGTKYIVESVKKRKMKYPVVVRRISDKKLFRLTAWNVNQEVMLNTGNKHHYNGKTGILMKVK